MSRNPSFHVIRKPETFPKNIICTSICYLHLNMVNFELLFASRSSFLKLLPCEEKLHSLFCIGIKRDCNIFPSRQHMQLHIDMKYGTNLAREILKRVLFIPDNYPSNHIICSTIPWSQRSPLNTGLWRAPRTVVSWTTNGLQIRSLEIRDFEHCQYCWEQNLTIIVSWGLWSHKKPIRGYALPVPMVDIFSLS